MNSLSAVIIDDENKARRILKTLVEEYCPDVEILGDANDVSSGVKLIHKTRPDLVFLDIEMPGYTGFQLLDFFDKVDFRIIFTTAYNQYAVQAFQVSAVDYLLKPIQIEQLIKSVEKVRKSLHVDEPQHKIAALKDHLKNDSKKIALPVSDGLLFIEPHEIKYLQADGSYCNVYLNGGRHLLISKKLGDLEKLLTQAFFFKPHRSYIININFVKQYVRQDGGYILMDNDATVSITRDKKEEFLAAFHLLA